MFQHILVPLDGTERAEWALPVAENIAHATEGELIFVRVVPSLRNLSFSTTGRRAVSEYLARQQRKFEQKGRCVHTRVLTGASAQNILACVETEAIDLIVMCCQGETGFKRQLFGSVARKVFRQSQVPVLISGIPSSTTRFAFSYR